MINETLAINKTPSVLNYSNPHSYLHDFYHYRKVLDQKFSYEIWSSEIGFKSRAYLKMVCDGKRNMTEQFIDLFSRSQNFNCEEKDHFTLLSLYHSTKSIVQKKILFDKILENVKTSTPCDEVKNYVEFLSSQALPVLQLLLTYKDFSGSEEALQKIMGVSSEKIKKSLKTLEKIGMIQSLNLESKNEKKWMATTKSFKVPDKFEDVALTLYHNESLKEAQSILNANSPMQRFHSIYFPLEENQFPEFKDDVALFIKKMRAKYNSENLNKKRLFKMNLQAFPLTEEYESEI